MSGLFGFVSNRADLGAPALHATLGGLNLGRAGQRLRWGIGIHQQGQVLLRHRPVDPRSAVPMSVVVGDVQAESMVGHFGKAPAGPYTIGDVQPWRYRNWLYAHSGPVDASEFVREAMRSHLPHFLQPRRQTDTVGELLFLLFVSCLHRTGGLFDECITVAQLVTAVSNFVAELQRIVGAAGEPAPALNMLASSGDLMVAVRTGGPVSYMSFQGPRELDLLLGPAAARALASRVVPRLCLVYSGPPPAASGPWTAVAQNTMLVLAPDAPPVVASLKATFARAAA